MVSGIGVPRVTEAQIIGMIKEQEAGLPTAELCRKHGLSPATFYKLKAKYGGMDLSDAKRLSVLRPQEPQGAEMTKPPEKSKVVRKLRCAVYTRKSSEEGLEQEFNSLHAQREACEAFIASQRSEGWVLVRDQYDDGGISGGTLERPGLKRLMADIEDGLVDVVVVYKIDRLSRSLADFAKLVEVFDRNGVTFVSVTQSFNTTTSMGRLTLNILLSFAQFEREVTAERIRDKVAASRRKGTRRLRKPGEVERNSELERRFARCAPGSSRGTVETVAHGVAEKAHGQRCGEDQRRGHCREPPVQHDEAAAVVQHQAKRGQRRLDAEADEREACLQQDRLGQVQGELHRQRPRDVRRDMHEVDPPRRQPRRPSRAGISPGACVENEGADEAGVFFPSLKAHEQDEEEEVVAEEGDDQQREDQEGERGLHIDQAHDRLLHRTAKMGGKGTEGGADHRPDHRPDQCHRHRDTNGVKRAREDVASQMVRAEEVAFRPAQP